MRLDKNQSKLQSINEIFKQQVENSFNLASTKSKGPMLLCPFVNKHFRKQPKRSSFVSDQLGLGNVGTAKKWIMAKVLSDQKTACSPHVFVRSTAMKLLSNNSQCLQGPNSSHLKAITVDVSHSNQKVNLPSWYLVTACGVQFAKVWHIALINTFQHLIQVCCTSMYSHINKTVYLKQSIFFSKPKYRCNLFKTYVQLCVLGQCNVNQYQSLTVAVIL